ncbi:Hypothetical protein FKW44_000691 [Caligus rogercresseyi]|uniref:Uncharacterized protein n=1 Tax=Caligus rogercresseyi TaxID=217165 RepID=A0A7T8KHR9_CALRO|nr:Hypothetical protein FKW44_000691 [Caligus rogercresseyi]
MQLEEIARLQGEVARLFQGVGEGVSSALIGPEGSGGGVSGTQAPSSRGATSAQNQKWIFKRGLS